MGCDIHSWAEVREAGIWRKVGRIWFSDYTEALTSEPCWRRGYCTFAMLADVRNGDGQIVPIAPPRGWPKDITFEGKAEYEHWLDGDGHSFSWHSLRHLLEYPFWHKPLLRKGAVGDSADSYYLLADDFGTEVIPRLLALASPDPSVLTMAEQAIAGEKTALLPLQDWLTENDRPGLDDVRMVFFFDN